MLLLSKKTRPEAGFHPLVGLSPTKDFASGENLLLLEGSTCFLSYQTMSRLNFTLEKTATGSKARAAKFQTLHGEVQTPIFMPVGTQATVKGQTVDTLKATGSRVLLANTYHLLLRPGPGGFQEIRRHPPLHELGWPGADRLGRLSDFLAAQFARDERGRRPLPELRRWQHASALAGIQHRDAEGDRQRHHDGARPVHPVHRAARPRPRRPWSSRIAGRERSLAARGDSPQALFGIVQGACHPDLRKKSAAFLRELPFDGLAIGGLAVGETHGERYEFTGVVTEDLPDPSARAT